MAAGGRAAFLDFLLKRDLSSKDIRNVPRTKMLAEQQALTRRGVDALIEWVLTEGYLPCAHPVRINVAITCDPTLRETFYDVITRRFPDLKYQTPTSITRALKNEWGCTSWHGGNQRGLTFPDPPELRKTFITKHDDANLPECAEYWNPPE
jgi:hypothetical protein